MKKFTPPRRRKPDTDYYVKKPMPLLNYLIELLPDRSRTTIKSYLSHRQIAVNGKTETHFDCLVAPGDTITLRVVGERQQNPNHKVRIVYEDDYIIVVDKKPGVLTMSTGRDGEQTAYSVMMERVRRYHKDNRVFIVHRLHRSTSGLLMFAKNEEVQAILQNNWNDNIIARTYVAVVEGCLSPAEGQIVSWLTENPKSLKMESSPVDNGGKKAITDYRTLKENGAYSLVELNLATGRKNQIRVQLASAGHPVAGDKRYGAQTNPLGRLCLHARTLRFVHPVNGQEMNFDTDIPALFR